MAGRSQRDEYGLTPSQRKFADLHRLYRERDDKFDYDAYMESFPTNNRRTAETNASKVLKQPKVAAYIAMRDREASEQIRDEYDYLIVRLIEELSHGALYNIQELLDENGAVRNIKDLPEHLGRAIASVKVSTTKTGKTTHEVKMMDKAAAIDKLMKYLGGYQRDRTQSMHVSGTVTHTLEPLAEVQEILDAVYLTTGRA